MIIKSDHWVTGHHFLHKYDNNPIKHIIDTGTACHEVDPATIAAYTGQDDKNGRQIFDLMKLKDTSGNIGVVFFINGAWRVDFDKGKFLDYNSSLLIGDHGGGERFEIVEDSPS